MDAIHQIIERAKGAIQGQFKSISQLAIGATGMINIQLDLSKFDLPQKYKANVKYHLGLSGFLLL